MATNGTTFCFTCTEARTDCSLCVVEDKWQRVPAQSPGVNRNPESTCADSLAFSRQAVSPNRISSALGCALKHGARA